MKRKLAIGLSLTSAVFLMACDNDGIETIEETVNELEETKERTVEELNYLLQEEAELQNHFDETLESDDELSSFGDGSSPVFSNLSDRRERVEQLTEIEEEYASHAEELSDYEGKELDTIEIENLVREANQVSESLETFREDYTQSIDEQENYFEGLADEDATYDTFSDGISELNDQHEEMRNHFYGLDAELSNLAQALEEVQQSIQETQSEGEE